ncbi:ubiquinone biosynthesis O-methyltransferase, mitochondrial-like [Hydractinia symbiolongicarpus]|uniref:ubiquinone biosynthesis O-methyltransferase, mitochondrial-like n=1 Tax=Hydractinia symbiolongicarpus TaxID=13093 RepID=UPI0025501672|nr:ubiquinone biosynthesis O-methyltransferase, mitochondrial-like [Hydractinia symbiolongicarpus]XP_057306294.1 ubiquinone biosynthesis O-methyltransferase, mitochondrial-like [Hydractinia symbiolongicarpus]
MISVKMSTKTIQMIGCKTTWAKTLQFRCFSSKLTKEMLTVKPENVVDCKEYKDGSSVSSKEMHQFQKLVTEWWRPGGEYDALRSLNKLRVPLIKKLLLSNAKERQCQPLSGYQVLDVGCGGGILAEPIARLGANVLGIDPLQDSIDEAKHHSLKDPDLATLSYECSTIEELAEKQSNCFDIVLASEVLEHVDSPDVFIHNCCELIKPGGHLFVTTINRTLLSTIFVKYAAEYLLRIVPQNTHDENKFITTDELTDMLRRSNMNSLVYRGMFMNPLTLSWSWTDVNLLNYACHAKKPLA